MTPELDRKLCADYPEIFRDRHGNPCDTAMCWSLEVGDGWYPLIDQLCRSLSWPARDLQNQINHIKEMLAQEDKSRWDEWKHGYYNAERLAEREAKLTQALEAIPIASQIKEKFGGLRFYVNGANDEQWAKIHFAESLSHRICEECGTMKDAMTYQMGWHRTLCPTHADEQYDDDAAHFRNRTGPFDEEGI